jgi:exonuclease VII large subunit
MTDNEIRAIIADTAAANRATARLLEESGKKFDARMEKFDARLEKMRRDAEESDRKFDARLEKMRRDAEESDRKFDARMERMSKILEEADRMVKETSRHIGGLDENVGQHAEQYYQNILNNKLEFGGMKYDNMIANLECSNKNKVLQMEFDIVLVNCKAVAIIEVKSRIRPDFIRNLVNERLPVFRQFFPVYAKHKVYLGVAGFSFSEKVLEQAEKYGIGVIRQVGDSAEMKTDKLKAY